MVHISFDRALNIWYNYYEVIRMIKCFYGGVLDSNAYLLYDGGEAMLIDCGVSPKKICEFLRESSLKLKYIILTHGHFDHVEYSEEYEKLFPDAMVLCHKDEIPVLRDPAANVTALFSAGRTYELSAHALEGGERLFIGDTEVEIIHTPGHSVGGICIFCPKENAIFVGDTLFRNGYGRTDFKGGSMTLLRASLKLLFSLDGSIEVYSGHGPKTTIGQES
ncbi:MAG: MBL fold metallo-hydrolase [Clostridia bacterium]|nr:MBL fold metallo-hydrolase [Clostridia bacterium]